MNSESKNNAALKRMARSVAKYDLTIRRFDCKFNPSAGQYEYVIGAARRKSGSRGGRPRNNRGWFLINLTTEQRDVINAFPQERK